MWPCSGGAELNVESKQPDPPALPAVFGKKTEKTLGAKKFPQTAGSFGVLASVSFLDCWSIHLLDVAYDYGLWREGSQRSARWRAHKAVSEVLREWAARM